MSTDKKKEKALACLRRAEGMARLAEIILVWAAEQIAVAEGHLAGEYGGEFGALSVEITHKSGTKVYTGPLGLLLVQGSEIAGMAAGASRDTVSDLQQGGIEIRWCGEEALAETTDGQVH